MATMAWEVHLGGEEEEEWRRCNRGTEEWSSRKGSEEDWRMKKQKIEEAEGSEEEEDAVRERERGKRVIFLKKKYSGA